MVEIWFWHFAVTKEMDIWDSEGRICNHIKHFHHVMKHWWDKYRVRLLHSLSLSHSIISRTKENETHTQTYKCLKWNIRTSLHSNPPWPSISMYLVRLLLGAVVFANETYEIRCLLVVWWWKIWCGLISKPLAHFHIAIECCSSFSPHRFIIQLIPLHGFHANYDWLKWGKGDEIEHI